MNPLAGGHLFPWPAVPQSCRGKMKKAELVSPAFFGVVA